MWQRWVSADWKDDRGFYEYAYKIQPTGSTTTVDGERLVRVNGMYVCESDYHPTRKAAMQANYEELRRRYVTLQQQCEALLQEIEKEGDA